MITKGEVLELKTTTLVVRVPIFESAGSLNDHVVLECTICYNPGNINGYKPGDVVWIGFEDNRIDKPVVLGKLYLGQEEQATNYSNVNSLCVSSTAKLSAETTIGDITYSDLKGLFKADENLDSAIQQTAGTIIEVNIPITDLR